VSLAVQSGVTGWNGFDVNVSSDVTTGTELAIRKRVLPSAVRCGLLVDTARPLRSSRARKGLAQSIGPGGR